MKPIAWPKFIEIETSRLCNRVCPWCPNGHSHARRQQALMEWALFESLLTELGQLNYSGWLALHNYNEPLLNPRLLTELETARRIVPHSHTCIFTNGDHLTRARLEELCQAGVAYVRVTRYPPIGETTTDPERVCRWLETQQLASFDWAIQRVRQGPARVALLGSMRVEVIAPDLHRYNYRGGTATALTTITRTTPCAMTTHSASIDYRGRLKMCCNVFPEEPAHASYVIGTLGSANFESLWRSEALNILRRAHAQANWSHSPICAGCAQNLRDRQPYRPGGGPG